MLSSTLLHNPLSALTWAPHSRCPWEAAVSQKGAGVSCAALLPQGPPTQGKKYHTQPYFAKLRCTGAAAPSDTA